MRFSAFPLAAALICASAAPVSAQSLVATPNAASARLGQCILDKTTGADRVLVARWMAASLAMAPQMDGVVKVDAAAKEKVDKDMAALFTRLFANDCTDEMKVLIKSGDSQGIKAAGGKLGEMAMSELMSNPTAMSALMAYMKYLDAQKVGEALQ